MKELSRRDVEMAIQAVGDIGIVDFYSGRGMNGRACFGITYSSTGDLLAIGAALAATFGDQFALDLSSVARTDRMGLGSVVYFPGYKVDVVYFPGHKVD